MTPSRPAPNDGALPPLPADVVAVTDALRDGLDEILGDALAGIFSYGAIAFARPPQWMIDVDFHVLLHRPLAGPERDAIDALHARLGEISELGRELDGYYVLVEDAARPEPPPHQLDLRVRDEAWALHRAHVHAGRFYVIAGIDPRTVVPEPSWSELEGALRAELRFVETHPEATAFGVLNGCRIIYSVRTHDVVVSKYEAAHWALRALPAEYHAAIEAARRVYERAELEADARTLAESWAPFVDSVRRSLSVDPAAGDA